jgi:hypothetical protein
MHTREIRLSYLESERNCNERPKKSERADSRLGTLNARNQCSHGVHGGIGLKWIAKNWTVRNESRIIVSDVRFVSKSKSHGCSLFLSKWMDVNYQEMTEKLFTVRKA